jgi:hypothetical protein
LEFLRGPGREFSVILKMPGVRGPIYPLMRYPVLVEFRKMLAALVADHETGDWTGTYFFADIIADHPRAPVEIWFRANENGITFGFSVEEWIRLDKAFRRAWELPDVRRAWDILALEYGEL